MMNLKEVFDRDFLLAHKIPGNKIQDIKQECTNASDFDLIDKDKKEQKENYIVEFGKGTGSFENKAGCNIEILAYDDLIKITIVNIMRSKDLSLVILSCTCTGTKILQ